MSELSLISTGNSADVANLDYTKTIECPSTAPTKRGFQILGPEGWRTFDQDERLLLAMTTDSQPLISTLKDISSRILNTQSPDSQNRLPIALARGCLSEARRALLTDGSNDKVSPTALAEKIGEQLEDEENNCPRKKTVSTN